MEIWESVASLSEFEEYWIRKGPVPEFDQAAYDLAFKRCSDNRCGHYGTNWGCNPGAKRDVARYYEGMDYVVIISREFAMDYHDQDLMDSVTDEMHRGVRKLASMLRDNGLECDCFLDGPCRYCGVCAYPEPCRFPDMLTPSLSTLGIGLSDYFKALGEDFSFREGIVTLYGFVFVKKTA